MELQIDSLPERPAKVHAARGSTRIALIEKAEELFGEYGLDAVSLRQIGLAAGSSNTNVVGYHIGDKDALIHAVLEHRVPAFDQQRAHRLALLDATGRGDSLLDLLHAQWLPVFEQVTDLNKHSYGRFLGKLISSGRGDIRAAFECAPITREIAQRIRTHIPRSSSEVTDLRNRMTVAIVTDTMCFIDGLPDSAKPVRAEMFNDAVRQAAAAIAA